MPKPSSRYERLDAIERTLAGSPYGCTTGELATAFGVDPDTIRRDLYELESRGTGLIKSGRRYLMDHRRQLHSVKLDRDQILALYLAARLLSRHSDEHNPHVAEALNKLADALKDKSPLIAQHIAQSAASVRGRQPRPEYIEALEVLTQGWAEGRKVRLRYRSSQGETTERLFAPYFVEPSGIGLSCYVIGYDGLRNTLRTLKVERVLEAQLTEEHFIMPSTFDPRQLLDSAWGIIWQEDGEIEVTLHFRPDVVRRVKESTWHVSQRIEDLPDGSCLFTVRVGNLLEIRPWVRQWGAAVTVVQPQELRQEIIAEVYQMAAQYGLDCLAKDDMEHG